MLSTTLEDDQGPVARAMPLQTLPQEPASDRAGFQAPLSELPGAL